MRYLQIDSFIYNILKKELPMQNIFLTTVAVKTNSAPDHHADIKKIIEQIKEICGRLINEKKEIIENVINNLGFDKKLKKTIIQFSKNTQNEDVQLSDINDHRKQWIRKLTSLEIISKEIKILKQKQARLLAEQNGGYKFIKVQKNQKLPERIYKKSLIKQINYRVFMDKFNERPHLKRQQQFLSRTISNISRNNKIKEKITRQEKQKKMEEIDNIVEKKKQQVHENYSIWTRGQSKPHKQYRQRATLTSFNKKRETGSFQKFLESSSQEKSLTSHSFRKRIQYPQQKTRNIDEMISKTSKRRENHQNEKQNLLINKTMQKLIKIVGISQSSPRIQRKPMKVIKNANDNSELQMLEENIKQSIEKKIQKKQRILYEESNRIRQVLSQKQQRIKKLHERRSAERQAHIQRSDKLQKQNIQQNLKNTLQAHQKNSKRQKVIRKYHEQMLKRQQIKDKLLQVQHYSDIRLKNTINSLN